jgi:hypothetical protein
MQQFEPLRTKCAEDNVYLGSAQEGARPARQVLR